MEKYRFTGKTKEEAITEAKIKLEEQNENNLIINEISSKKGLFSKKIEIEVIEKRELIKFIKEYIYSLVKNMGFSVQIEIFNKEETPIYKIYSELNNLFWLIIFVFTTFIFVIILLSSLKKKFFSSSIYYFLQFY